MKLGSHCSMTAPDYLLGSVKEALSYGSTALMVYTGAPQNTRRKPIEDLKVPEAKQALAQAGLPLENMVIHAPYIINLANVVNPSTYELAVDFLKIEIERVQAIGATYLVLHPGSFTTATPQEGLASIIKGLNEVLKPTDNCMICLETMAGKGSEIGFTFEQLNQIREGVLLKEKIGYCLDTCHIHDAGYDIAKIDEVLDEFDRVCGLENLKVLHINDSKNGQGARKDRHANLGEGEIGFDVLNAVVHHPRLKEQIKILETPWVNDQPPYQLEIEMLLKQEYDATKLDILRK